MEGRRFQAARDQHSRAGKLEAEGPPRPDGANAPESRSCPESSAGRNLRILRPAWRQNQGISMFGLPEARSAQARASRRRSAWLPSILRHDDDAGWRKRGERAAVGRLEVAGNDAALPGRRECERLRAGDGSGGEKSGGELIAGKNDQILTR